MSRGSYQNYTRFNGPIQKRARMGPRDNERNYPVSNRHQSIQPHNESGALLAYKDFVFRLPDNVSPDDANSEYKNYVCSYYRRAIEQFFEKHSDEEWFREKYRPVEMKKRAEAIQGWISRRKEKFHEFIQRYPIDGIALEENHSEAITRLAADFSLFLEGVSFEVLEDEAKRAKSEIQAIYLTNIEPSIDRSQIIELVDGNPHFLRLGLSDPDQNLSRKGWLSFKGYKYDELRSIYFNMASKRCSFFINMNNKQPICRKANHEFNLPEVARADLHNLAKLLVHFEGEESSMLDSLKSCMFEDEKLDLPDGGDHESMEEDGREILDYDMEKKSSRSHSRSKMMKVIDRTIIYLRLVYSFDYYSAIDCTGEEEMPQKVGFIFVRPAVPPTYTRSERTIHQFIEAHKLKIKSFTDKPTLSEVEQDNLGRKNVNDSIDLFLKTKGLKKIKKPKKKKDDNEGKDEGKEADAEKKKETSEENEEDINEKRMQGVIEEKCDDEGKYSGEGKEKEDTEEEKSVKWVCSIDGKKFETEGHVRKHILNRHPEQIEECIADTIFYNNYVADPRRPI